MDGLAIIQMVNRAQTHYELHATTRQGTLTTRDCMPRNADRFLSIRPITLSVWFRSLLNAPLLCLKSPQPNWGEGRTAVWSTAPTQKDRHR